MTRHAQNKHRPASMPWNGFEPKTQVFEQAETVCALRVCDHCCNGHELNPTICYWMLCGSLQCGNTCNSSSFSGTPNYGSQCCNGFGVGTYCRWYQFIYEQWHSFCVTFFVPALKCTYFMHGSLLECWYFSSCKTHNTDIEFSVNHCLQPYL